MASQNNLTDVIHGIVYFWIKKKKKTDMRYFFF